MVFRKSAISLFILLSLVFSFAGSFDTGYAVDSYEEAQRECICICEECDETLMECICPCVDCDEAPDECICVCEDCDELKLECICLCEECDELSIDCICVCEDCNSDNFIIDPTLPGGSLPGTDGIAPSSFETLMPMSGRTYTLSEQLLIRLYRDVHNRPYDPGGLAFWEDQLKRGLRTGGSVAYEFFFSREFLNHNHSNSIFLDKLYTALMGRTPDGGGRAYWLNLLNYGLPREDAFAGFVNSPEFDGFCRAAGITRGTYHPPRGGMARIFVVRLYDTTLNRAPDLGGLNFWHNALVNSGRTGASVAYDFIFSPEMYARELDDAPFLEILYQAMMGRASDPSGRNFWLGRMSNGESRYSVFANFVHSPEFDQICRSFGIVRGTAPQPLRGRIIFLDPGHGTASSPGAAGYNEAVAMLDLARRLRPLLESQGATVIMTRNNEVNIPISVRCAVINIRALEMVRATTTNANQVAEINRLIGQMNSIIASPGTNGPALMNLDPFNAARRIHPDLQRVFEYTNNQVIRNNMLVISLHSNAPGGSDTSVNGAEVYFIDPATVANTRTYYPGYSFTPQSRAFGNILLNHISRTSLNGASIRRRSVSAQNYAMIREINVPAVLAENGFHTNPNDRALLSNPTYRQMLAVAYQNAVVEYFR